MGFNITVVLSVMRMKRIAYPQELFLGTLIVTFVISFAAEVYVGVRPQNTFSFFFHNDENFKWFISVWKGH